MVLYGHFLEQLYTFPGLKWCNYCLLCILLVIINKKLPFIYAKTSIEKFILKCYNCYH